MKNSKIQDGSYLIKLDPRQDDRNYFFQEFFQNEFKENGLNSNWVQINNSYNKYKGTIEEGCIYKTDLFGWTKLVSLWHLERYLM